MNQIRIIIADDHPLYREGLKGVLHTIEGFQVVGEANDGKELIHLVEKLSPEFELIISDLKMPGLDGVSALKHLLIQYPDIRVLALTMHEEENFIMEAMQAGAKGYLLKGTARDELKEAITTVLEGEIYVNRKATHLLLSRLLQEGEKSSKPKPSEFLNPDLTEREMEVLKLIVCDELTNEKIAQQLFISKRTVDTHRKNLLVKLGAHNTVGLVKYAVKIGMI